MLHEVKPHIITIQDEFDMLIDRVSNGTISNKGTLDAQFSFGDGGWADLASGEQIAIPAGAETIFTSGTRLFIRFVEPLVPSSDDVKKVMLMYNEFTAIGR